MSEKRINTIEDKPLAVFQTEMQSKTSQSDRTDYLEDIKLTWV